MAQQFEPIYHGLSSEEGKFRVAASGMAWKGVKSETTTSMKASDIKWAQWLRVARNFQLRVGLANHRKETFDGFQREDHDQIASLLKNYFAITLETKEITFKGWNWGVADFQGPDLAFVVSDKTAFELPLASVANSNIAGKTEVSLELATASKTIGDELVEIRFHVPGAFSKLKGSASGSQHSDDDNDEEEISAAQVFHDTIKEKADIGQVAGDIILSLEDVPVLTPRGRYDMDLFPEFLRMRGKTYDYKILYSSISKLFLLPKDDLHVLFMLSLNTPIRQGQTRYQYLVMQFTREEEITAELNMSEEEVAKYDRLKKNYEDPTFEVVSSVFRALAKKKIIGAGGFQSRDGHPCIKANLKAQPTLVELSDIHSVVFSRIGGAAVRTFDIKIVTRSGPEYTFTSINKEEHESTETYLKDKKVKVKNEMAQDADLLLAAAVGDDDDDDEMQSVNSDDSPARVKSSRDKDDDDSETDEDFQASSSDEGSPSESDSSDEGGAATASDASGDVVTTKEVKKIKTKKKAKDSDANGKPSDAEGSGEKKKKKKKPKKAEDAMDVDDDEKPKPKGKPKPKSKAKDGDDAMDVDVEKPRPKPKPKVPKKDDDDGPPKKKAKVSP
ncbi:SSrecog-domain-containing protein [Mycena floridula]|nr:SSrecog-domain-containing protein [Mycena floridula]